MKNETTIYILDTNETSREIFKNYIEDFNLNCEIKLYQDYKEALENIKKQENNLIVFADISEISNSQYEIVEKIKLFTSKIIITSTDYSTDTIIKAMRAGAKDFLPKPVLKSDLERIVKALLCQTEDDTDLASKIITIYSNKGGIGKTTIATNLAIELAKSTSNKVALIDLNLQLGDVSTFLNLNPKFDVAYFIQNLLDKKEDALLNAFEKDSDTNLYILSDPNYIEQSEALSTLQISALFKVLRKVFSYIIIDISSNIDPITLKILDETRVLDLILPELTSSRVSRAASSPNIS